MSNQLNFFELHLFYEADDQTFPKTGWVVKEKRPSGFEPLKTARGNPLKMRIFENAVLWIRKHRPGYSIRVYMIEKGEKLEGSLTWKP